MQLEILKFLLEANAHRRSGAGHYADKEPAPVYDLQAVERVLPDRDWFEAGEEFAPIGPDAGTLWAERGVKLEF